MHFVKIFISVSGNVVFFFTLSTVGSISVLEGMINLQFCMYSVTTIKRTKWIFICLNVGLSLLVVLITPNSKLDLLSLRGVFTVTSPCA